MSAFLEALSAVDSGSLAFLAVLFLVNALGELSIPFPFVMQGVLLFVGYNLSHGNTTLALSLVAATMLGSLSGAVGVYSLSRWVGGPAVNRLLRLIPFKRLWITRAQAHLTALGPPAIALGRLTPGLALPTSLTAGTLRVPWSTFLLGVLVSEAVWAGLFVGLGVLIGRSSYDVKGLFSLLPGVLGLVVALMVLVTVGQVFWRQRRSKRAAQSAGPIKRGG